MKWPKRLGTGLLSVMMFLSNGLTAIHAEEEPIEEPDVIRETTEEFETTVEEVSEEAEEAFEETKEIEEEVSKEVEEVFGETKEIEEEEPAEETEAEIQETVTEETVVEEFAEDTTSYEPGVVITENKDYPETDAEYQATFTFEAPEGTEKVTLAGTFQFYDAASVEAYKAGKNEEAKTSSAYEYKKGMTNAGFDVLSMKNMEYDMENVKDNIWTVTLPLPATEYSYAYNVYKNGEEAATKTLDPTNMPYAYEATGQNCGWSLIYVGGPEDCLEGQQYIYPRSDAKKGTFQYVTYTTSFETEDPIFVYLPYGYNTSKTYKTLYMNGSTFEWPSIGSLPNIMDNLIAEGLTEECVVVVTNIMSGFYHIPEGKTGYEAGGDNIVESTIPFIESQYSVSTKPEDRAIAGLSANGVSIHTIMSKHPEAFGYYAPFSAGVEDNTKFDAEILNKKVIYETLGTVDYVRSLSQGAYNQLEADGVDYIYDELPGAHDWGMWRYSLTNFLTKYAWTELEAEDEITVTGAEGMELAGVPEAVKEIIKVEDTTVKVAGKDAYTDLDIGEPGKLELGDNNYVTGYSYYNVMELTSHVKQLKKALEGTEVEKIHCGDTVVDKAYVDDLDELLDKLNSFDRSLVIKYDFTKEGSNYIAENKTAKLAFHVQTNGYWGYDLAGDSIIDKVTGEKGGYMENQKLNDKYANFFAVDMTEKYAGMYVLNDTDLQNPVLFMDDSEAFLIDVDFRGGETLHKLVEDMVGDRKLSIYITHAHGDHYNNMPYWAESEITKFYWGKDENKPQDDWFKALEDAGKVVYFE
ncbi:MAG: hypothetical protein IKR11_13435, partial [Solobacterium sp.]|nr:hypothetical protein [Solobacterium sp.]